MFKFYMDICINTVDLIKKTPTSLKLTVTLSPDFPEKCVCFRLL